jgi:hypothetical protein
MQALLWVVPILLLAYFLKQMGPRAKSQPLLSGCLAGGTVLFYVGLISVRFNPNIGSTIQLLGACLFFSGVALDITKKTPPADKERD